VTVADSALRVLRPGPFTTLQDLGRRGRGHQGVARSGAFDLSSHRLANRLVGNEPVAATLEILLGPCEVELNRPAILAVTGTNAEITITNATDRRTEGSNSAFVVQAGERITIGVPTTGLRTYLSARGGFDASAVLGSRSYDSLGLIGPGPLKPDDSIPIGEVVSGDAWFESVPRRPSSDPTSVDLRLGPRHDWLTEDSLERLGSLTWTIDPASNRTGVRFAGPVLQRRSDELASEAMIPGAVQLPLSGLPIVLGPDGGTTGGYPVIGVIPQDGLDALAQRRPGEPVRFRIIPAGH
jgi:biotin-dependent carboxylase-like uncharacterized protein